MELAGSGTDGEEKIISAKDSEAASPVRTHSRSLKGFQHESARTSAMDFSAVIAIPQIKTTALNNYLVLIVVWTDV